MDDNTGLSVGSVSVMLDCTGTSSKTMTTIPTKETRVLSEMGESSVGRKSGLSMLRAEGNTNFYSKPGIMPIFDSTESLDSSKRNSANVKIRHIHRFLDLSRFPKLDECAHFHYDMVEINTITLSLLVENQENQMHQHDEIDEAIFYINVTSNSKMWTIRRTYDNFRSLDKQLHKCIYDRKYSQLPEIPKGGAWMEMGMEYVQDQFSSYLHRLSQLAGPMINCGPVLNWIQMDNRGNRLMVSNDSAINTPAVGAAHVTKRYTARAQDELSFEVGDIISVIDMPPPEDTTWWRGKRGFEVGYFPSECIEMIGDTVPQEMANRIPQTPPKAVLRKRGKLISFLRTFFTERPTRNTLKQSGIFIERVFGCDLGEHLLNTGQEVPMVLKCCADFIETHGIVDGIYRLSGVASNIQRLRQIFDENEEPDLNTEEYVQDVHCISSLLKLYFRELPNPLLTYQLYDTFADAVQDDDNKLMRVHDAVQQLPPPHYRTSQYLFRHLAKVAVHGGGTGMHPKNLAIVWAPNLLRSKDLEAGCGEAALQGVGLQAVVTEFLIRYADIIFSDKLPAFGVQDKLGVKRARPKSLAISTPTKLLSLEEAREKALCTGNSPPDKQKFIDVGGGPQSLPDKYHTVIELPGSRKRSHSMKGKKGQQTSSWKNFFLRNKAQSKGKGRKGSMPSTFYSVTEKALTEEDLAFRRRLRATKSVDSIISLSPITPDRSSKTSNPYSVPGVINVTMLQTGRKLPLSLSVQKPVHKSSSLPDTSFSRSFTLHSDEESDLDLDADDSPDDQYELGGFLIAKEAAQVAAKTNLMTKLEEKMCDNIESTSSPDVALLSTSAPVMLMSPLENFLIDDIQSFSWSESSSEVQKSPSTESPRTKKASRSDKNSPLVSPGRRSHRSSGSASSIHRRTSSQERLKGSYGKLNRSPSDEIFPMEMTESYDKDDLLLVTKTRASSVNSSERVECRVDVHNRSYDDVPADVCMEGLFRQRSNSYQSALSEAGVSIPESRDLKTPDSLTQTPQLDSELDLTNIIDKIFTFSSSVSRDTASSEILSSMVSSDTQSRDVEFTNEPEPPAERPAPDGDPHPLRKSKSYERAIEGDDYTASVLHRLSGAPSIDEEEYHVLDPVPEEKSRTPSSEKDLVQEVVAALPTRMQPVESPIAYIDQESVTDDSECREEKFVEQQTPYLHIVERLTPAGVIQLENTGETTDHSNHTIVSSDISRSNEDVTNSNQSIDMIDDVNNVVSSQDDLSDDLSERYYENVETHHHGNVLHPRHQDEYYDNTSTHSNPELQTECHSQADNLRHSVDNLLSDADNHHGNLDLSVIDRKSSSRLLVATPDNVSLSPSEDDHYHLMYSLASTPSMGTLCSNLDTQVEGDLTGAPHKFEIRGLDLALVDEPTTSTCSDYSPNEPLSRDLPPLPRQPEPELVDYSKPQLVEYSKPEPVDYSKPEPVDYSKPEPVDYSKPEPVDYSKPEPVDYSKPEPVDYSKPEPVDYSKPNHQSVTQTCLETVATPGDSEENFIISYGERATSPRGRSPELLLDAVMGVADEEEVVVAGELCTATGPDRRLSRSHEMDEINSLQTDLVRSHEMVDISAHSGSESSRESKTRNDSESEMSRSQEAMNLSNQSLDEDDVFLRLRVTSSTSRDDVTRDFSERSTVVRSRDVTPEFPTRGSGGVRRGNSSELETKLDSLEATLDKFSAEISSKKKDPPKRNSGGIAAKFEAKCHSETKSETSKAKVSIAEDPVIWRTSDVTSSRQSDVTSSRQSEERQSSEERVVKIRETPERTETPEKAETPADQTGTPVKRKKSVRELTSKFEPDVTEKQEKKTPPREVASLERKTPPRDAASTERTRAAPDVRSFERQTSLERLRSPLEKCRTSPKVTPKWTPASRTETSPKPTPEKADTRPEFPKLGDRQPNRTQPADVTTKTPDVTTKTRDVITKTPDVTTKTRDVITKIPIVNTKTPDVTTRPRDVTASRSPDVTTRPRDVTASRSPDVVNRPQLKLSETPKWTPQWTPQKTPQKQEEREEDEVVRPLVQKRSPDHSPETEVKSPPVSDKRNMPMLTNRFSDRPDLFALSAKFREPQEPVPVEPESGVTVEASVELPKTPGQRIPLLDRRRSLRSPNEDKEAPFWLDKNRTSDPQPELRHQARAPPVSPKTWMKKDQKPGGSLERRLDPMKRVSSSSETESESNPRGVTPPGARGVTPPGARGVTPPVGQREEERRLSGVKRVSLSEERSEQPLVEDSVKLEAAQTSPDAAESSVAASMFGVKLRKTKRSSIDMDHRQSGEFRQSWVSTS